MAQSHFLSLKDWSREEIELLFEESAAIKANPDGYATSLAGKSLAMIFQKPSTRTRVSFEVGMFQLGGQALFLGASDIQLHRGESIADTARVLSRYVHGIMARVFAHQDILDLARHGSVPVINGLSDLLHPCQALADYFTLRERRGDLTGLKMAYVGDGNNVAHELMFGAVKLGMQFSIGCPTGYEPNPLIFAQAGGRARCERRGEGEGCARDVRRLEPVSPDEDPPRGQGGETPEPQHDEEGQLDVVVRHLHVRDHVRGQEAGGDGAGDPEPPGPIPQGPPRAERGESGEHEREGPRSRAQGRLTPVETVAGVEPLGADRSAGALRHAEGRQEDGARIEEQRAQGARAVGDEDAGLPPQVLQSLAAVGLLELGVPPDVGEKVVRRPAGDAGRHAQEVGAQGLPAIAVGVHGEHARSPPRRWTSLQVDRDETARDEEAARRPGASHGHAGGEDGRAQRRLEPARVLPAQRDREPDEGGQQEGDRPDECHQAPDEPREEERWRRAASWPAARSSAQRPATIPSTCRVPYWKRPTRTRLRGLRARVTAAANARAGRILRPSQRNRITAVAARARPWAAAISPPTRPR